MHNVSRLNWLRGELVAKRANLDDIEECLVAQKEVEVEKDFILTKQVIGEVFNQVPALGILCGGVPDFMLRMMVRTE